MKFSSPALLNRLVGYIESVPASDRLILRVGFLVVIAALIYTGLAINAHYSQMTAISGGTITEGIVGTPRFTNPALAQTRADQDMTALIYSGLMKLGIDGNLEPDIAETITTSEDGLTYNIQLKRDITFHDGTPVTARDVAYTIRLVQDPDLKSPLRGNWTDVTIEEISEYELNIVLEEAYAPFVENFTLGVMPAHIWSILPTEQLPFSQLNTEPVGSGPFMVTSAKRDVSGIINHYTLSAYRGNSSEPKIDTIELAFFQNEEDLITAVEESSIDTTAYISPENITRLDQAKYQILAEPLPRTFGIFFNQNRSSALRDASAREALTAAINRDTLIEKALFGYGVPMVAPTTFTNTKIELIDDVNTTDIQSEKETAIAILKDGGWELSTNGLWGKEINENLVPLTITLRTSNTPLYNELVALVTDQWKDIGVEVVVEQFEQTGLVQSVIRTRDFQALLFGLDMSRSQDLYPFWHSSQKDDPGLNVAQYTNLTVDDLLETARVEQNDVNRQSILSDAADIIEAETPAIFLFQPDLVYLVNNEVSIKLPQRLARPADRFANISDWHTDSQSLWPIFRPNIE